MAAYWMIRASAIKDEEALKQYQKSWGSIAERYQAKVIASGEHQTPEGPDAPRVLIIEFPSYQQAIACYEDAEYQQAMVYANTAFDREMTIIDGA